MTQADNDIVEYCLCCWILADMLKHYGKEKYYNFLRSWYLD